MVTVRELYHQAAYQTCPHCGYTPKAHWKHKVHEPTTLDRHGYGYISQEHRCYSCTETFWPEAFKVDNPVCPVCDVALEKLNNIHCCPKCGLVLIIKDKVV